MAGHAGVVRVEVWGLLPTYFSTKCKVFCNPTGVAGVRTFDLQLMEYPEHVQYNQLRATEIFNRMAEDFPGRVLVKVVSPTSARGIWLSLKHRLSDGLWLILNGKRVVDAYEDYTTIKREIEALIDPTPRVGGG